MAMYSDTLNQTFPGVSSAGDGDLHRSFHISSTKSTGLNFEQQFLFDNALHSITYQAPLVSCQQITTEHLDRLCYSPRPSFSSRVQRSENLVKTLPSLPKNRSNPFRAFLLVNRLTSTIVSVNRQACEYFWYTENELKTKSIDQLMISEKSSSSVITESFLNQHNGQTKILAGKIVQIRLGTGECGQFSLFMQDLDGEHEPLRFYAFEPIHIMQMKLICDKQGFILSSDQNFSIVFQNSINERTSSSEPRHIAEFLPTLKDSDKFQQLLTHRTYRTTGLLNSEKNLFIPLMINLSKDENDDNKISLTISIMSNVSGLIMLDESYTIRAYNPYFIQSLLGYRSLDLINHHISEILPELDRPKSTTNNLSLNTTNEADLANLSYQSLAGDDDKTTNSNASSNTLNDSSLDTTPQSSRVFRSMENQQAPSNHLPVDKRLTSGPLSSFKTTSTPLAKTTLKAELKNDSDDQTVFLQTIGKHKNGTSIGVIYTLHRLDLPDGTYRYSLWLSRDNTDPHLIEMQKCLEQQNQSQITIDDLSNSFSNHSLNASIEQGTFDSKYVITRQRGRGGYGQVYLGHDKFDEEKKVVIKFIKKTKVKLHRYVESFEGKNQLLFEVAVLKQLKHPNIVQILDAFDTENYVQMVMPLHGQGIDVYEFVEKGAKIDEPLASYIFRQLVDAVSYLHGNHIAHQDIKDENLIINDQFHIKLIDFGSAISITQPDMYTSNFGGTTEFCCPEFFQTGSCQPFLADIWAMMVTLYVIIFRRYPFSNPDEIKRCQLDLHSLQSLISDDLYDLFTSTLIREPCHRLTMHELERHDWVQQAFSLESYSWTIVTQNSLEETFLTGNHFGTGDDENNADQSFASLTRQIQNQYRLVEKPKTKKIETKIVKSNENNLFAYLNCKHASI